MPKSHSILLSIVLLLGSSFASHLPAQTATAVPQLDLNKLTGTWYQIAKLPEKSEKKCLSDGTTLYALNDKPHTFQVGTFCVIKGGDHADFNNAGRQDKLNSGKLQLNHWVFLHRPYWVLATGPSFEWALVGTPNHKSLWLLSRQARIAPDLYQQLQDTAAAQGFPVGKLILVSHPKDRVTIASPSANPSQIETPAPTPTNVPPTKPSF